MSGRINSKHLLTDASRETGEPSARNVDTGIECVQPPAGNSR